VLKTAGVDAIRCTVCSSCAVVATAATNLMEGGMY